MDQKLPFLIDLILNKNWMNCLGVTKKIEYTYIEKDLPVFSSFT